MLLKSKILLGTSTAWLRLIKYKQKSSSSFVRSLYEVRAITWRSGYAQSDGHV